MERLADEKSDDEGPEGLVVESEFDAAVGRFNASRNRTPGEGRKHAPEGVTVHRDLKYAVEDGESLRLDIYMPTNANPPRMPAR